MAAPQLRKAAPWLLAIAPLLLMAGSPTPDEPAPLVPLTHEPIVPVMHLLAQDLPAGIRPGAWMEYPHACTMAFVLNDAQGRTYITTAGHCVDWVGQRVTVTGHGEIGTVVAFENQGWGRDFALVRIHDAKVGEVDPRMAGFGGPTSLLTATPAPLVGVKQYGFGAATWYTHESRCRTGLSPTILWTATYYRWYAPILWGDSGSPAITADGAALGINTHLDPVTGTAVGTRFSHAMARLEMMTGLDLSLVGGGAPTGACSHT